MNTQDQIETMHRAAEESTARWVLSTDGSGNTADGRGGFAAHLVDTRKGSVAVRYGFCNGTTPAREEAAALAEGLFCVLETERAEHNLDVAGAVLIGKPSVVWHTDRQDLAVLVGSAQGLVPSRRDTRETGYADLWARLLWLLDRVRVFPVLSPRNTTASQELTDRIAGLGREMAIEVQAIGTDPAYDPRKIRVRKRLRKKIRKKPDGNKT